MSKSVALILLNWNTPKHTINCIASLKQFCNNNLFDIIVADNGSTDDSLSILRTQFPDVIYIDNNENLGFAEGNNRAVNYSIDNGYTYSLVINTDTLVNEDIVTKLSGHLDLHPEAAVVQPAIYWMHDKDKIWNGRGKFNKILGSIIFDTSVPVSNQAPYEIADCATGCCMLIRNSALAKSGLFNKKFFLYYEDIDLSFRIREAGYEIHYLPSCKMYHEAGVSAKVSAPKKEGNLSPVIHYYVSRNHIWFLRRYAPAICFPVYLIYHGAYYAALLIYFILRGRNQKARFLVKGVTEGLFTPQSVIWSDL